MSADRAAGSGSRLLEVDALRGVAALSVVLFHYTTRFSELYATPGKASLSFPHGHYGVNLFFIISGFVIFMTLARTERPMDFVVSRFSRLFPAYWVAIFVTFALTHALGLPGKLVGFGTAVLNMLMIQGLFRIEFVDGVYWTLEVELIFYAMMLLVFRLRWLHRIHLLLLAMLGLRLAYFGMAHLFGIDLPWTVYRLLILEYIPWFAIGICIFQIVHRKPGESLNAPAATTLLAIAAMAIGNSLFLAGLALALALLVLAAASGRLPLLRWRVFTALGAISYPLYLLHENIGWSIELRLLSAQWPMDLAIAIALAITLMLSGALTLLVERPAMKAIRAAYKRRRLPA